MIGSAGEAAVALSIAAAALVLARLYRWDLRSLQTELGCGVGELHSVGLLRDSGPVGVLGGVRPLLMPLVCLSPCGCGGHWHEIDAKSPPNTQNSADLVPSDRMAIRFVSRALGGADVSPARAATLVHEAGRDARRRRPRTSTMRSGVTSRAGRFRSIRTTRATLCPGRMTK